MTAGTALQLRRDPPPRSEIPAAEGGAPAAEIGSEGPEDGAAVMALVDAAFGPGRYAKSSERLREGNRPRADLSVCARAGGALVGTVRLWPVEVGGRSGLFLGPIAVEPGRRREGLGARLIAEACARADAAGEAFILLVGDPPLFEPHGFHAPPPGSVRLPGPADPRRILLRLRPDLAGTGAELAGDARIPPEGRQRPARGPSVSA